MRQAVSVICFILYTIVVSASVGSERRLSCAEYVEGSQLISNKDRYTEKSTAFTPNGGVTALQRNGLRADGSYGKVDDLMVAYSGNRMTGVSDAAPAVTQNGSMDFPGGNTSRILTYNAFGALASDAARDMTSVSYDSFGNPLRIQYSGNRSTSNVYSASGEKLKTVHQFNVAQQAGVSVMSEAGMLTLLSDDLVLFPGGYATVSGTAVTFHYYTQDYLGNNRAVINGTTGAIEQTIAYYPYGAVIADLGTPTTGQPYKFGGKEFITANGLNEYDFGARQYYSAVPGFTKPDPMCEKYYWLSPYIYCGNNPVNAIDPYGCDIWSLDENGHVISSQTFEDFDMLLVYYQNMKPKANWIGDDGSVNNQSSRKDRNGEDYAFFEAKDDNTGTSIFEFLADNTSVEWQQLKTGYNGGDNTNYISTSHSPKQNTTSFTMISDLCENGVLKTPIREAIHNHPSKTRYPSGMREGDTGGDVFFARWIDSINSVKCMYKIYAPLDFPGYSPYVIYSANSVFYEFLQQVQEFDTTRKY